MNQAQHFVATQGRALRPSGSPWHASLSAAQASTLQAALRRDAEDYLFSGVVSIADAAQAIDRAFFTWATVKLYYSVFYLCRAQLAASGIALLYEGSTPYSWHASPGAHPVKQTGPTHKATLATYADQYVNSPLLSQPIDTLDPFDWLVSRREEANYRLPRFTEPAPPPHFRVPAAQGMRRAVTAYLADTTYLYTFDPSHAMIAFPLELLRFVQRQFRSSNPPLTITSESREFLATLFRDRAGRLAAIKEVL